MSFAQWFQGKKLTNPIEKAALSIQQAFDGEIFPETLSTIFERDCYVLRDKHHHWYRLWIWLIIVCELLRRPHWTFRYDDWEDKEKFPRSSIDYIPSGLVILLEFIALIGIGCCGLFRDIVIEIIRFQPNNSFPEKKTNQLFLKSHPDRALRRILVWILVTIFILKWIEILIHSIVLVSDSSDSDSSLNSIRSNIYLNTFPLECVFALIIEKRYFYILKTILRTLPRFFSLIAQFTLLICVFTGALLILINHDTYGARTHYDTYSDALWTNINVMNGANWPTPFVDLYKQSRFWALFFVCYVAVASWGMLNCITGLMLGFFRTLRNETQIITHTRSLMMLAQAYEALRSTRGEQQYSISLDSFRSLLRELTSRYTCIKGFSSPHPSLRKQCLNRMRGVDAQADYEEDLDILLGVFNFHFRRIQLKGTTEMLDDLWSAAVIQTPFRPAFDWIEEYCTDLPLLNCDVLVKLQRQSLLPPSKERLSSAGPAIKDLSSSGIPIDLFFQFFVSLITKQDVTLWGHAIGVLCEEFKLKQSYPAASTAPAPLVNGHSDVLQKQLPVEDEKDEESLPPAVYDTHSSRYLNILTARYEKNPYYAPRDHFFDDNIRLQWKASRYEYFQSSFSAASSNKRISLEKRFAFIRIFASIVNSQRTQFLVDSLVCFLCLLIVAGVDSHGLRIFLLTVAFLESATRYLGKSFKRVIQSYRYRFDTILTVIMFIVYFTTINKPNRQHDFAFICSFRLIIFVPRNILLLKSMRTYRRTLKFGIRQCILASFDAILLLLFLLSLALIFAGISTKAFGGLIQISGTDTFPELSTSIFGDYNYYVLCYNDPLLALGSLFVLLMVNNTFIISKGVEVVTEGSACRVFFMAWYILGVLFLLNLFSASILTSFMNFWLARHQTSTYHPQHRHSHGEEIGQEEDEFEMPTRMTTYTERTTFNTHPVPPHLAHLGPLAQENGDSLSSPSLSRSEMAAMGSGNGTGATAGGMTTHRLSHLNVKNNSFRMRYSNLDDEIFQWVTNFQENPALLPPTPPPSAVVLTTAASPGATRASRQRRQTLERDEFEMDEVSRSRAETLESLSQQPESPPSSRLMDSILNHLAPISASQDTSHSSRSSYPALSESRSTLAPLPHIPEDLEDLRDSEASETESMKGTEAFDDESHIPRSRYLSTISAFPNKLTTIQPNGTKTPAAWDLRGWYRFYLSQKLVSVTIVEYTATLLQCAKNGSQMLTFKSRASYLCYRATKTYSKFFRWTSWILCLLTFFSKPRWTMSENHSSDQEIYPTSRIPYLPTILSTLFAIILLFFISIGLFLEAAYNFEDLSNPTLAVASSTAPDPHTAARGKGEVSSRKKTAPNKSQDNSRVTSGDSLHNPLIDHSVPMSKLSDTTPSKLQAFLSFLKDLRHLLLPLFLILCNFLLSLALTLSQWILVDSLWLILFCYIGTRWLVFIYLIWFNVLYLKALLILLKTLPLFALMISLLVFFIFIAGVLGRYLFINLDIPGNGPYFGSMADSLWTVLVATSSSSFPSQLIPSYTDERWTMLYFFFFITFGSFIFLKLQFVAIFASFESNRQLLELKSRLLRMKLLNIAFQTMDVDHKGYLTFPQVNEVLEEVYGYYSGFRKGSVGRWVGSGGGSTPSNRERALLLKAMDRQGNGRIYQEEFMMILDLTRIQVSEEVEGHFLNSISPKIIQSVSFIRLFQFVHTRRARLVVDLLIFLFSAIAVIAVGVSGDTDTLAVHVAEILLYTLILLEILGKVTIIGPKRIWSLEFFRYDVIIGLLIICFGSISTDAMGHIISLSVIFRVLLLFRASFVLRNIEVIFPASGFSVMASTLAIITRRVSEFLVPVFLIMYGFASLGATLFGGLINKDPDRDQYEELQSSPYGEEDYYQINFNDLLNSFVLLFTCLHVSGWDTISSGFSAVTNEITGRLYFALWYCIGVLLLMNVITSFFISAFILKINSWNFGGTSPGAAETGGGTTSPIVSTSASASGAAASAALPSGSGSGEDGQKPFLRTNVLSIKQSSLDETILEYPADDYSDDLSISRNSFQMIIDNSKSKKEKRYLSTLSLRYSSAINNERVSEVKSLLTSAGVAAATGGAGAVGATGIYSGSYRKNFIVDAEKVRDLSDGELMVIIHRMMEEKKATASPLHR